MIGRLAGVVLEKKAPYLLIDVNGVGYELQCPMTTFYNLPELGSSAVLHTHFSVSENAQQLFGFFADRDRALFRLLIKVNGVGPKMALGILSGMEADDFVQCVAEGNVVALTKVPGVGKKTAERLLIEMRDKLANFDPISLPTGEAEPLHKKPVQSQNAILAEAESALVALGYKPTEASRMIATVLKQQKEQTKDSGSSEIPVRSEELIRSALKSTVS